MSHNSDEANLAPGRFLLPPGEDGQLSLPFRLSGSQSKTAYALRLNCEAMIAGDAPKRLKMMTDENGKEYLHWVCENPENLNCVGFLTLTVGQKNKETGKFEQVKDAKEASRRINNLARRVLKDLFEMAIVVTERHKSQAIHFHILGILLGRPDIRTGINWHEIGAASKLRSRGQRPPAYLYKSANQTLRGIWANLREKLPDYGFGQAELLPIRKTGEAVACYISKYIEKNLCNRTEDDKHKKLVRYIGWKKTQLKPNEFAWAGKRATAWRLKTAQSAGMVGVRAPEEAAQAFGPRWAWHISEVWKHADDSTFPGLACSWPERVVIARELAKRIDGRWLRKHDCPPIFFFGESPVPWSWRDLSEAYGERIQTVRGALSIEQRAIANRREYSDACNN